MEGNKIKDLILIKLENEKNQGEKGLKIWQNFMRLFHMANMLLFANLSLVL